MISTFDEFVKLFWASIVTSGKCPHCTEKTVNIRKEGSNKFFLLSNPKEKDRKKSGASLEGEEGT
jgi:hypothetical protein